MIQLDPQITVKTRPISKDIYIKLNCLVFALSIQLKPFDSDSSVTFSPLDGLSNISYYRKRQIQSLPFQLHDEFEPKQAKVAVSQVTIISTFRTDLFPNKYAIKFQYPVEILNA